MKAVPINKKSTVIENSACVESLSALSAQIGTGEFSAVTSMSEVGVSIITPPGVTRMILEEGYQVGVRNFFLQPGTYDRSVDAFIRESMSEANVVKGCVIVDLGFEDDF